MTDTLTSRELQEIDVANTSGRRPVVFVHGLWLLASSWDRWRDLFEAAGFATVAPGWPDDPDSIEQARAHPEVFAHKMVQQVTDHYAHAIRGLDRKPAVIGHSFGGLMAQMLAGQGLSAATVAIDPSPFRGVLPVPASAIKASAAVLSNPANRGRATWLRPPQPRRTPDTVGARPLQSGKWGRRRSGLHLDPAYAPTGVPRS
jgi:non-heme chloroperoxidase